MSKIVNLFSEIGNKIDSNWYKVNFNKEYFPNIAREALETSGLNKKVNFNEILFFATKGHSFTDYYQESSNFGDIPLILYRNEQFYIELLVWNNGVTSIHDHAFSGAFMVMQGKSINVQYDFKINKEINHRFKIGRLHGKIFEVLLPGDVREILSGKEFIHAVYHFKKPTVSIVVRTYQDDWAMPQLDYRGNVLAVDQNLDIRLLQRIKAYKFLINYNKEKFFYYAVKTIYESNIDEKYWIIRSMFDDICLNNIMDKLLKPSENFILDVIKHEKILFNLVTIKHDSVDKNFRYFIDLIINIPKEDSIISILRDDKSISIEKFFYACLRVLEKDFGLKSSISMNKLANKFNNNLKEEFLKYSNFGELNNPIKQRILSLE